ncbi:MAG: flagellar biosynthesis protein FlhF [Candidatus Hinthialibacter antarcticus]|nr:flagellar biosynthesis protein FlhF [Candidatus Hinthialibacter antarcticus]
MKRVKAELGHNAIILHSRETGKGLFGLFGGRGVEVTAAVDDAAKLSSDKVPAASPTAAPVRGSGGIDFRIDDAAMPNPQPISPVPPAPVKEENPLLLLAKEIEKEKQALAPSKPKQPQKPANPQPKQEKQKEPAALEERLGSLENQLIKLTGLIENLSPVSSGNEPPVPVRTRELYNHLLDQEVDESLALTLAAQIAESTDEEDDIWTVLKSRLIERIPVAGPLELDFDAKRPKVIMLVGSTGVGKTTTLAKISALYRYNANAKTRPKIVFITADLYRLAAVEQLQKYTEILGVELEVTYSPDEVKQAINKHKNAHLILFDTAGACQRNAPQLDALASIKEAAQPDEVHLVLSSTSKFSDMIDVIEHFKVVEPRRFIFTKIDESTTYGGVFNTVMKYETPISYLTTGQNVPEDIESAKPERVAKLLLTKPAINRSIEVKDSANKKETIESKPVMEQTPAAKAASVKPTPKPTSSGPVIRELKLEKIESAKPKQDKKHERSNS